MARTHYLEFRKNTVLKLDNGKTTTGCRVQIGVQVPAQVRCYVIYANDRYTEVADIVLLDDAGTFRGVPCACFKFIDVMD
jgi:hypothetical protein